MMMENLQNMGILLKHIYIYIYLYLSHLKGNNFKEDYILHLFREETNNGITNSFETLEEALDAYDSVIKFLTYFPYTYFKFISYK